MNLSPRFSRKAPQDRVVHFPGVSSKVKEGGVHHHQTFPTNRISTTKYNLFTFLPKFLFAMFTKAAYFYFLVQTCLSWWEVISPFGGIGFTMALLSVLIIAGLKEGFEDRKRHLSDKLINCSTAHVVDSEGRVVDQMWQDVKVGQILLIYDGEEVPADCICLHTALDNCYVHTANLDGETNLKIKKSIKGVELSDEEAVISAQDDYLDSRGFVSSAERAQTMKDYAKMEKEAFRLSKIVGEIHCELPSADLYSFKGYASVKSNPWVEEEEGSAALGKNGDVNGLETEFEKHPMSMGEMLLRGTTIMNSGYVFGLVIYSGKETRILMNSSQTPMKCGSSEYFLNIQIVVLAVLQLLLCIICAVASYFWRDVKGRNMYYLMMNEYDKGSNFENPAVYIVVTCLTFWILYSAMVPISLFITLEVVRFWQCIAFINFDPAMRVDEEDKSLWPKARNSNVIEDLAKITYIFSDKTGTLTSNDMQLRFISIGSKKFGSESFKFENVIPFSDWAETVNNFDSKLMNPFEKISTWEPVIDSIDMGKEKWSKSFPHHALNFFSSMALCHSVLPQELEDGDIAYQGPSPDEVCIVGAAKKLGFTFNENKSNIMYLNVLGKKCKFRLLNTLEFSSDRKRMSVIVQDQRKRIYLICKGADSVMLPRLEAESDSDIDEINKVLHDYSVKGLRCLLFASKTLSFEEWNAWNLEYKAAANDIEHREERMSECMDRIEEGLQLLGVTAVEDKLQEEVPESIEILRRAGIKVWVITGDKQETAINIGVSCKLITDTDKLMIINESCEEKLKVTLQNLLEEVKERRGSYKNTLKSDTPPHELVVDGKTLKVVFSDKKMSTLFASVGALCDCVLVCRASPAQKASVVDLMKEYEKNRLIQSKRRGFKWVGWLENMTENKMLSIGDGANDVPMIQRADIGVGIVGKEGRQASNNSDFSIARFKFLVRLLLIHGQTTQYRNSNLIKYSFYKNIAISIMFFYFQFDVGFSGQAPIDTLTLAFYNTVFTFAPILIFSLCDRPVEDLNTLLEYPQTYNTSKTLTVLTFWKAQVKAFVDAAICYFIPAFSAFASGNESLDGLMAVGRIAYLGIQGVVTLEVLAISRHFTSIFVVLNIYSYFIMFPFFYLFEYSMQLLQVPDPAQSGVATLTFASASVWLQILLIYALSVGIRLLEKALKSTFYPDDVMILSEKELAKRKNIQMSTCLPR